MFYSGIFSFPKKRRSSSPRVRGLSLPISPQTVADADKEFTARLKEGTTLLLPLEKGVGGILEWLSDRGYAIIQQRPERVFQFYISRRNRELTLINANETHKALASIRVH